MAETWKPIKEYPNYNISNTGRVMNTKTKKILKLCIRNGYYSCSLCKNNTKKTMTIHRLVARTFMRNTNKKNIVNHKDGNKLNNYVSNLEWISSAENNNHALRNGFKKIFKVKVNQYDLQDKLINTFSSIKDAEMRTGINAKHISAVCLGKRKSSGGYKWSYTRSRNDGKPVGKPIKFNKKYLVSKNGEIFSKRSNKFLKPKTTSSGYLSIGLSKNGIKKDYLVHRLVAITYIKNPQHHSYVNHIDSDKQNNNIKNLEWCSQKENMIHHAKYSKYIYKVNVIQLTLNNEKIKKYNSIKDASIETGIDKSSIVRVCKGKQKSAGNYKWSYVI